MRDISKLKIFKESSIKQALKVISDGAIHIAVVVNSKDKFLGTLSDGDIRRGLLKGLNLDSPIKSLISKKPIFVKNNKNKDELLKLALDKKIYQIPVIDDKGKILGIHVLDELINLKNNSNKVVIMAGGKGLRLRPLTKYIPKPMLKVGGKPILETLIKKIKESGYLDFIICVNYKSKIIEDYFGNGKKFGVNIEYIREKKPMGTAGALSLFKNKPIEPFFVINGDLLTNLDFKRMLDFHCANNSKATMCIREYNFESPYGEVRLENENIKSIEEKPIHKYYVNAGVYILDPSCLGLIPNNFFDMPSLFKKIINKNFKTVSFPLGEYWLDIGRLNDYKKANLEFDFFF